MEKLNCQNQQLQQTSNKEASTVYSDPHLETLQGAIQYFTPLPKLRLQYIKIVMKHGNKLESARRQKNCPLSYMKLSLILLPWNIFISIFLS